MRWLLLACLVACDSGSAGSDAAGSGPNAAAKSFCVGETNRYRAMNNKSALPESAALDTYADAGAMHDFTTSPHDHFSSTGGGGIAYAENECPQQGNWQYTEGGDLNAVVGMCIAAFYAEGPGTDYATHGHYINMMGAYGSLGCGIYFTGGKITIVQDYGN